MAGIPEKCELGPHGTMFGLYHANSLMRWVGLGVGLGWGWVDGGWAEIVVGFCYEGVWKPASPVRLPCSNTR